MSFAILFPQQLFSAIPQEPEIRQALKEVGIYTNATSTADGKIVVTLYDANKTPGTVSITLVPASDGKSEPKIDIGIDPGDGFIITADLTNSLHKLNKILNSTQDPVVIADETAKITQPVVDTLTQKLIKRTGPVAGKVKDVVVKYGLITIHNIYTLIPFGMIVGSMIFFGFTWHDYHLEGIPASRILELASEDIWSMRYLALTYGAALAAQDVASRWKIFKDTPIPKFHSLPVQFVKNLFKLSYAKVTSVGSQILGRARSIENKIVDAAEVISCEDFIRTASQTGVQQ